MFLKLFKTIATLLVLISISGIAQARSLDEILKSGVLKGGVNPGLPPLAKYDDKNNLVGFDADIMAKHLGFCTSTVAWSAVIYLVFSDIPLTSTPPNISMNVYIFCCDVHGTKTTNRPPPLRQIKGLPLSKSMATIFTISRSGFV